MSTAFNDQANKSQQQKTELSEAQAKSIVEQHLALWNEQDTSKHVAQMQAIYAPDIEMIDKHFVANGYAEVAGFITGLHDRDPEARFRDLKPAEFHHNLIRLYWQSGPEAKPDAVTGMDMFIIENGKVQKLLVFVDGM